MVRYGTDKDHLQHKATSDWSTTYDTSWYYTNRVTLSHLKDDTVYYYLIDGEPEGQELHSFKTAKKAGSMDSYTAAVVVDMGTFGHDGLSTVVPPGVGNPLKTGEVNTIQRLKQEIDSYEFVLHPGDISYGDYWLKETVLGYINGTIEAGPKLYERITEEFYDELEGISSEKAYMIGVGNVSLSEPSLHL